MPDNTDALDLNQFEALFEALFEATYATQGGGRATYDPLNERFVFTQAPDWAPGMLGAFVPEQWDLQMVTT